MWPIKLIFNTRPYSEATSFGIISQHGAKVFLANKKG
jgi:hypothetical protein